MKLKHVGVLSLARIAAVLYGVMGLIFGAICSMLALFGAALTRSAAGQNAPPMFLSAFLGVGAIVFLPIFYAVMGFLGAAFSAWVYNILAGALGGVELQLE